MMITRISRRIERYPDIRSAIMRVWGSVTTLDDWVSTKATGLLKRAPSVSLYVSSGNTFKLASTRLSRRQKEKISRALRGTFRITNSFSQDSLAALGSQSLNPENVYWAECR